MAGGVLEEVRFCAKAGARLGRDDKHEKTGRPRAASGTGNNSPLPFPCSSLLPADGLRGAACCVVVAAPPASLSCARGARGRAGVATDETQSVT